MALTGAATLPQVIHVAPSISNKFPHFQFSNRPIILTRIRAPRIIICRVKQNGSIREEQEEMETSFFYGDDVIDDESDEDDTESSIDLLFRFFQSMFRKLSKRAKKASRSILPAAISPQLVSFAVDGVLLLASLSIVRALLEVVCTLGGTVFVVILLLRMVWATVSHFQSSGNNFNQGGASFSSV